MDNTVLFCIILFFEVITAIILFCILVEQIKTIKHLVETKEPITPKTRKHTAIKTSNYNNSFNKRAYDLFKNEKTGLYEPQKPHNGIELKSKKED